MNRGYIQVKAGINPLDYLDDGYVVMNCKFVLDGFPLFTYHRDTISSKTVFNTEYPTYTYLIYNYDGNFLSVCPGSHMAWMCDFPITLSGEKGDGILFDCDLVHGGVNPPDNIDFITSEYIIVHINDLVKLEHLFDVYKHRREFPQPWLRTFLLRVFSYIFVVIIQLLHYRTRFLKSI
jgi:hypothetical protein